MTHPITQQMKLDNKTAKLDLYTVMFFGFVGAVCFGIAAFGGQTILALVFLVFPTLPAAGFLYLAYRDAERAVAKQAVKR